MGWIKTRSLCAEDCRSAAGVGPDPSAPARPANDIVREQFAPFLERDEPHHVAPAPEHARAGRAAQGQPRSLAGGCRRRGRTRMHRFTAPARCADAPGDRRADTDSGRRLKYGTQTREVIAARRSGDSRCGRAHPNGCNPGDVCSIPARPYRAPHFAAFPHEIPATCIKAGYKPGGIVLEPFCGTGTTGVAALTLGRRITGIDLIPAFAALAAERRGHATEIVTGNAAADGGQWPARRSGLPPQECLAQREVGGGPVRCSRRPRGRSDTASSRSPIRPPQAWPTSSTRPGSPRVADSCGRPARRTCRSVEVRRGARCSG